MPYASLLPGAIEDNYFPRTDHHMKLFWPLKDKKFTEMTDKPVVDLSEPFNFNRKSDQVSKFGVGIKQRYHMGASIAHFTAEDEVVPYQYCYSTDQVVKYFLCAGAGMHQNSLFVKINYGDLSPGNPRTLWAHKLHWLMSTVRFNVANVIAVCGYWYGYEFCYTYVPFVRIKDPSPEGWKKCWQEGQSTYLARILPIPFLGLGHWIYIGSPKRTPFWMANALFWFTAYEFCRPFFAGNQLYWQFRTSEKAYKESRYGSLVPDSERRADPDTGRPRHAANYKFHRANHGMFQEDAWANLHNDNAPLRTIGSKIPNIYFNWQKASQCHNGKPYRTHNDVWDLPSVLSAKTLCGVDDRSPSRLVPATWS